QRDFRVAPAEPALGIDKAGNPRALRDVLGVVPVVELVLGDIGEIHRRDQNAVGHRSLPRFDAPRLARPGQARRVTMIPATISPMPATTSQVIAPPKIIVDKRKPPIGVKVMTWPAIAAGITASTLFHRK